MIKGNHRRISITGQALVSQNQSVMNLELKKIKVIPRLSEETTCFYATLYVDGKPAADCANRGVGAMTDVRFYNTDVQGKVMEWCNQNPVVQYFGNKKHEYKGVDIRVDELLVEYQMKKELMAKQKKALVLHENKLKDPDYVIHKYLNLRMDIETLMKDNVGRNALKQKILEYRKKGITVMNTNIDYKVLGLDN